jgi:hypothetical protein
LSKIRCDTDIFNEFFKIAWEIRSTQPLKDGAIDVITTLFNRIPSQSKKVSQFFHLCVFHHATKADKVERSARAFLRLIQGDISGVTDDASDILASIACCGTYEESFVNTFLIVPPLLHKVPFPRPLSTFPQ